MYSKTSTSIHNNNKTSQSKIDEDIMGLHHIMKEYQGKLTEFISNILASKFMIESDVKFLSDSYY